jgi:hypothetical protein
MRKHPHVSPSLKPSPRQAIAIPDFLLSKRMRYRFVEARDFIQAAVATSCPENQAIARRVATEIFFGKEREKEENQRGSFQPRKGLVYSTGTEAGIHEGQEKILQPRRGLPSGGIGSGNELFKEWIAKLRSDRGYKYRLMRAAEEVADKIAVESSLKCESTFFTKEDRGPLEGYKLRCFQPGDDPDLIDFDETIQNLSTQGKELARLSYDDFIVRERKGQRGAVVLLEDISGSMEPVIKDVVICSVILVYAYALRRYEIALAFFESDAYVVKELFDRKDIGILIEEMLGAQSMVGTRGAKVLRWGREQLENVDGRYYERVCFLLSDLGFQDIEKVASEIKRMMEMDIKVIVIHPSPIEKGSYSIYYYFDFKDNLETIKKTNCVIVGLDFLEEILHQYGLTAN